MQKLKKQLIRIHAFVKVQKDQNELTHLKRCASAGVKELKFELDTIIIYHK